MADLKAVGIMLTVFVGVVVALAIFTGGVTSPVAEVTQKFTVTNEVATFPDTETPITFAKGQAVSSVTVVNASGGGAITASNYTIKNYVVSNGALVSQLSTKGASLFNGTGVNISYTYEPYGYATDAGSRSMFSLVIIFAALAVAVFAIVPILRNSEVLSYFR